MWGMNPLIFVLTWTAYVSVGSEGQKYIKLQTAQLRIKHKWRWHDELELTSHLPTVLRCDEESQDPVDQICVGSFLLQIQNTTDDLQFGVGEIWTPTFKHRTKDSA